MAEDKEYDNSAFETNAKMRGMDTVEFLEYARTEMHYCRDLCEQCKAIQAPPKCEFKKRFKEAVNQYCGRYVMSSEKC